MLELEVPELLPDEALVLKIPGGDRKVRPYAIQPVNAEWWYKFAALRQMWSDQAAGKPSSPEDEKAVEAFGSLGTAGNQAVCLGPDVVAQMLADGVSARAFEGAVNTAYVWHVSGGDDDAAAKFWASWWSPKAKSPSPSSTSTTTGAAPTAKPRASGSGTTSRPKRKTASTRKRSPAGPGKRSGATTT